MTDSATPAAVTTVLVANRGEIARRVFATCRRAGLGTVAVYSDPDEHSPHVHEADVAVRLPGASPSDTYLRGDRIVAAALAAGADAVHPGYGFLSENAEFAAQVIEAGLCWIGPTPETIARMGSKIEAKKIMAAAGVPVLLELEPDAVTAADLPVLVKASSGGGGRGMRVVRTLDELPAQLAAASREAGAAFGDPTVFCERYLEHGRHIEVQILADRHGTVWTLGERECSVQRRHQKVVEESPSPLVEATEGMRAALFDAARRAATAIGYEGAGTVEFLAPGPAGTGEFYFLEMNTRLQVEHPVTECTTGVDLVELQIDVASGGVLEPEPPLPSGHSIEVRLYAEDPAHDWQPQSGVLHRFAVPAATGEFAPLRAPGIRVDAGVVDGTEIGVHYDPMLAKVISWAPTRPVAARMLARAVADARLHGPMTNRDLLVRVLRHPAFLAGDTDTAFFDTHDLEVLAAPLADSTSERIGALVAALADAAANRESASVAQTLPSGWRNLPSSFQVKTYTSARGEHEIRYRLGRDGLVTDAVEHVRLLDHDPHRVILELDGLRREFAVARYGDVVHVDSSLGPVCLQTVPRFTDPAAVLPTGSLLAPMPGSVIRLGAAVGDTVTAGQPVLWLEAMKMEHTVTAPVTGTLTVLDVAVGTQVTVGSVLAVVTSDDAPAPPSTDSSTSEASSEHPRTPGAIS
ncbi:acetyl/propionyl/methylcrotonyl-CoA carboxylase subunit alpha [Rhodococcus coprophilus]|uniref:acetyl/propionyl/methylcrotonyl-CoA carboxylase subunit alpha n=1 Tax=Rhodococcus coprophilus TaxID=38310 RepID=UPI00379974B7